MITISIQYFAILREQRGLTRETVQTEAQTAGALYEELRAKHHFSLPLDRIRAAINGEFASSDARLETGAEVVFIPPVAGG